jgi:transposase-like protein
MPTPLTNKQQYWSTQLENAEAFDGSIADYARSQGVSKQALYRWRHCLRQREVSQSTTKTVFTQVVSASFPSSSLTLAMGDAKLTFTRLPDPQWIAQLLSLSRSA